MEKKMTIWAAVILAAGIMLGGVAISRGIHEFAMKDRSVTVKGLSTRDVEADHVVWPMSFALSGMDLPSLYRDLSELQETIRQFLIKQGFDENDIQAGSISVSNNWNSYYGDHRPEYKYTISGRLVVSTDDVQLVKNSQGCTSKLLSRGIIIETSEWAIDYQYNSLSELKPTMIEEATKNARAVAQKFADDANCRLGSIRRASQGQFSVEEDSNCPWVKHVRVVTTVDYFLN